MKKALLPLAALMVSSALATPALAGESVEGKSWDAKERFMIRARAIGVLPAEDSTTSIGGEIQAEDAYVPEVDFTYFFSDNIAMELIAATAQHEMEASNTGLGNLDLGDVWILPPTLTLQYHFNPHGQVRPYVGAGVNYIYFYNADPGQFSGVDYQSGFGYAAQAGVDYALDEHWALNADVKKVWHKVDAKVNGGAVTADVDLDPWIVGLGIGYRF